MPDDIKNKIYCGDNLDVLQKLEKESVDLIYIDPPFFSNKQYEVVWGDEAEIRSFEDRWEGGVLHYINWLKARVNLMWNVLKPTGSFYLHCDWHANAYIRIMLDEVFGESNFQNEIIWCYKTGGASKKRFGRKHDNIYFYTKSENYTFNPQKEKSYMMHEYGFKKSDFQKDEQGQYSWVIAKDWWEIPSVGSATSERLGYPTQKPEALLERIIKASSDEGDLVLDAFCGCGTACVVAQKLKRNWIGIDISPTAATLVEKRLAKIGARKDEDYVEIGFPTTISDLKNLKPFEFQNWVINEMQANHNRKKVGDMGLDGYYDKNIWHEKAGIQVKQSENVGRNVVDNFETALKRAGYNKGYVIAFSYTKGAVEEAARIKNDGDLDIRLLKVEDLLLKKVKLD